MPLGWHALEGFGVTFFNRHDAIRLLVAHELLQVAGKSFVLPFLVRRIHTGLLVLKEQLVEGIVAQVLLAGLLGVVASAGLKASHVFAEVLGFVP